MTSLLANRSLRRMVAAVVTLAIIDAFVPRTLARVEHDRYESNRLFRFENSDLFSLGPLVDYLREHPEGAKPRAAFFGDSIVWGYLLKPSETVPAQFQRLRPDFRVLNFGINGFETPNAFLIAKNVIDSLDTIYVFDIGRSANPKIPDLIPVQQKDLQRFALTQSDPVEHRLKAGLDFWKLYSNAYRLQSALFGTSTRIFLYLHKADIASALLGHQLPAPDVPAAIDGVADAVRTIEVDDARAAAPPPHDRVSVLAGRYALLWDFAATVMEHRKRAVFVELVNHSPEIQDDDRADLNAFFAPWVRFVRLRIPTEVKIDRIHLSPIGSAAVAEILVRETLPSDRTAP